MPGIADTILSQMAMAGKPRVSKQTTTQVAPEQPYDISMLPLLLYLIMGQQTKAPTESIGMTMPGTPRQTIQGASMRDIAGIAPSNLGSQGPPQLQALLKMFGML